MAAPCVAAAEAPVGERATDLSSPCRRSPTGESIHACPGPLSALQRITTMSPGLIFSPEDGGNGPIFGIEHAGLCLH